MYSSVETALCVHETQFTIISTHIGNSAVGSSVTPAKLGDRGIQQLKEKVLQWKYFVQRERNKQEDKTRALALEVKMSHGKIQEIAKLRSDLKQAVQEREVYIIILFLDSLHALYMYM